MSSDHAWTADELARDLDLIVFELEQPPKEGATPEALAAERKRLRRKLERIQERLQDLARAMM